MKQFFKSKFFYIITVITLLAAIVPTVMYSMGVTPILRNAVGVVLTPLQKIFNSATDSIDGFAAYFYKFDELREENERLKEQVASLQSQIYDASELEKMYEWMTDFIEVKIPHTDYKFLAATVTGHESGNYSKVLNLDVGSSSGVRLNMPVITADGIVGRVTEVGLNWSKVTTIVEANSSVGAYVERTNDAGVCVGKFELSSGGLCELNYLPADSDVKVGDRVLSTGFGSVYPRGLVVGYVESVEVNPYTRALSVKVKCSSDFSTLTNVMIITSYETVAIDGSELTDN